MWLVSGGKYSRSIEEILLHMLAQHLCLIAQLKQSILKSNIHQLIEALLRGGELQIHLFRFRECFKVRQYVWLNGSFQQSTRRLLLL